MSLELVIIKQPQGANIQEPRKSFTEAGGAIGRAADNHWSLPDPERFVSSRHASISYDGGNYILTDTSTNGVYMNGSPDPLGTGNQITLKDGDKMVFGEYEIRVDIFDGSLVSQDNAPSAEPSSGDFDQWLEPEATPDWSAPTPSASPTADNILDDLVGGAQPSLDQPGVLSPDQEILDPLAALDGASNSALPPKEEDDLSWLNGDSEPDNAPALDQAMDIPNAVPDPLLDSSPSNSGNAIPDDWDDDFLSPNPTPKAPAPKAPPAPKPADVIPPMSDAGINDLLEPKPDFDPDKERRTKAQSEQSELDAMLGLGDASPAAEIPPEPIAPAAPIPEEPIAAAPPSPPPPAPKPQQKAEPAPAPISRTAETTVSPISGDTTVDQLIASLGLNEALMTPEARAQLVPLVSQVLAESVDGIMKVLSARSTIKNELRMSMTTIQPKENNPLKFSVGADEAMENMFVRQGKAYMNAIDAVRDGYNDIADHQVAVLAGMRAAFNCLMERFDPAALAEQFEHQMAGGLFSGTKKSKYWEAYQEYYERMVKQSDESFQNLFGDDFAEAYEEQLQQLKLNRQ